MAVYHRTIAGCAIQLSLIPICQHRQHMKPYLLRVILVGRTYQPQSIRSKQPPRFLVPEHLHVCLVLLVGQLVHGKRQPLFAFRGIFILQNLHSVFQTQVP